MTTDLASWRGPVLLVHPCRAAGVHNALCIRVCGLVDLHANINFSVVLAVFDMISDNEDYILCGC